jgi:signal transduction histidine kinase
MLDKLFGNAREHASGDGPIRVAIRARDGTACVTVENDGELLPPDRRLLFEPFVPGGKGDVAEHLGIGLYVARTIAHRHGGDIVADDLGDGRGVAFEVRLPLADAARPGTAQSSSQR